MTRLEQLPPEQQAVLSLLVRQGRSYAQVAQLLGLDAEAVRRRAQEAVIGIGGAPEGFDAATSGRIGDYLLGQSDTSERIQTLDELMSSAPARTWARRVARGLGTIATVPLPAVPDEPEGTTAAPSPPAATPPAAPARARRARPRPTPEPSAPTRRPAAAGLAGAGAAAVGAGEGAAAADDSATAEGAAPARPRRRERTRTPRPPRQPRTRRAGGTAPVSNRGAGVLLIATLVIIAAVVVFVTDAGGSSTPPKGPIPAAAATSTSTTAGSAASTSTTASDVIGELKLTAAKGSSATGQIALIKNGSGVELAFSAAKLTAPASGQSYVLLLYNPSDSSQVEALGRVPSVSSSGSVGPLAVTLPSDASKYKGVALMLEDSGSKSGGQVVLYGSSSSGF